MQHNELNEAINAKSNELEMAIESEKSYSEILKLYKELKQLKFQRLQSEVSFDTSKDLDLV
jgi:hypothetical protein